MHAKFSDLSLIEEKKEKSHDSNENGILDNFQAI